MARVFSKARSTTRGPRGRWVPVVIVASTVSMVACGDDITPTSREALEAATYLTAEGATVTLTEGGGVSGDVRYALIGSTEGDLDFDGEVDAAAVLAEFRGDAVILRLHAMLSDGEIVEDVSARLVGDRIRLDRLTIEDGEIRVGLAVRNPGEPVTIEPSVPFSQDLILTDRGIIPFVEARVEADAPAPRSADPATTDGSALYTHEWILDRFEMGDWAADLSVLEEPAALRFVAELVDVGGASGQMTGYAGCNRIFSSYRAEGTESLRIIGLATTRRACEADVMDFEQRFLSALGSTTGFSVSDDRLEVSFSGGTLGFTAGGRLAPTDAEAGEQQPSVVDEARRQT